MQLSRLHLRPGIDGSASVLPRRRPGWRHPVVQFLAAGLIALVVIVLGSSWLSGRAATEEAIMDARDTTELLARAESNGVTPSLRCRFRRCTCESRTPPEQ